MIIYLAKHKLTGLHLVDKIPLLFQKLQSSISSFECGDGQRSGEEQSTGECNVIISVFPGLGILIVNKSFCRSL